MNQTELENWYRANSETLNLLDPEQKGLAESAMRYLMNEKLGHWDKEDAIFTANFLARKSANVGNMLDKVTVKVLSQEEYSEKFGDTSQAMCTNHGDETYTVTYSPAVIDNLMSNTHEGFLRGLQTVFHEIIHTQQNTLMRRAGKEQTLSKSLYLMALETIARKEDPKFYQEFYDNLLKENQAQKLGLKLAMTTMQMYNPYLHSQYRQDKVAEIVGSYDKNYYDKTLVTSSGRVYDFMLHVETIASRYIEMHPEMVREYPCLQRAYNFDGTKKDILQLLADRKSLLEHGEDTQKINEFYEAIINHRNTRTNGLKGVKNELHRLDEYLEKTGTEDEFIYDIIKYQLEKKLQVSPDKIEQYVQLEYEKAAKAREKEKHTMQQTTAKEQEGQEQSDN
ncbi:MAG: hypothetical protein IJ629_01850 [Clostridia bacterium]|nr:hypothetical protein [Clostridia bacterium]